MLAGRYNNPIPTLFQASIDCLKIPALALPAAARTVGGCEGGTALLAVPGDSSVLAG